MQHGRANWRKSQHNLALLLVVALSSCSTADPVVEGSQPTASREQAMLPNLLLLVAEDLSPRVGFAGDRIARTPNLDALAAQGVHYTRVFTTAGVCAPSRAAMILGQHQISFAGQHMRTTTGPLGPYLARPTKALKAFPELLRRAGYFTFTDGKLDYQFSGIRAGSGPFSLWDAQGQQAGWHQRDENQPFFGLINFNQTHESGVMTLKGEPINAVHAATRQWRTAAGLNAPVVTDPASVPLPGYYPDLPAVREDLARHYDNINRMDHQVGAVLKKLAADGLADNTIVIWTTDHGDGLPRAKRELFDSGLHVPLIAYFPPALAHLAPEGWTPGFRNHQLVSFVDLAPTVLALAKIAPPELLHGRNMFDSRQRSWVFASRDRIDEIADRQRAIRTAQFKYIESYAPGIPGGHKLKYRDLLGSVRAMRQAFVAGKLNPQQARWFKPAPPRQLYDLNADPEEVTNLAGRAEYAELEQSLRDTLHRHLQGIGDTGEQPEGDLRASLLDADGGIPKTAPPNVVRTKEAVELRAADNASVEYQLDNEAPRLYVGPLSLSEIAGRRLSARAVRYGFTASERITEQLRE